MVKLNLFFKLLIVVLLCTFGGLQAAVAKEDTTVKVSTEREILSGKSFNLKVIVTTDKVLTADSISYPDLKEKFQVGNFKFTKEQSEKDPSMNVYKWDFPLLSSKPGVISVNPFTFNNTNIKSSSFQIQVKKPATNEYAKRFIKTMLRSPKVYEDQLVMYRVETDILPDVKIQTYTPPKAENARIELYQEKVISRVSKDNSRANPIYKTQIREYKIIFNKPGRQVIEGPSISGIIKSSNKSFIQSGENQTIEVKPNPEHNLVSDNVTVHVQWTPEDPTVNVGQAITRSITLRGHNNAISQFPDLSIPEMPNYDIYVETTKQTEKLMKNKTFISTVSIKQVFVPKKNHDTFEIPDQNFVWMNPNNNEKKEAVIKGAQYEVSGFSFNDYIPRDPRYTHWIFMSIFACIFLGIFGYYSVIWYRERVGIYGKLHQLMDYRSYWKQLRKSWSKNDPYQTRTAILEWAQKRWPQYTIVGLSDLPFYANNKQAFDNLSAACWSPDKQAWNDSEIRKVINRNKDYRKPKIKHGINPYGLNGEIYETVTQKMK